MRRDLPARSEEHGTTNNSLILDIFYWFLISHHCLKFTAQVSTPKAGEYALIDKVVLGIMGNITALKGRKIDRPCSTRPTAQSSVQAEKEEVANEYVLTNVVKRPTLATSTTTTTTSTSSTSQVVEIRIAIFHKNAKYKL